MKKIIYLFTLLLVFNFGYGQELVSYSSAQSAGCSGIIFNDPNISATGICRGPGISNNPGGTYNSNSWTTASTIDANDYLEWTLTANLGYYIDLTSMDIRYDRSPAGPTMLDIQVDSGSGFTSIFTDNSISQSSENNDGIDLSSISGVSSTVTFRLYAFNASAANGTFDIEQRYTTSKGITIYGNANVIECPTSTTWTGTWSNGLPNDLTKSVVINSNYNTTTGDIMACSLTVGTGATLTIGNNSFAEVEHDVTNNGTIVVETQGNFVQNDDAGIFTNNGSSTVNKTTASKADWFYYTYWSSPVTGETIGSVFPDVDGDRRFWFNAGNFVDTNGDDIDDNGDDWQVAAAIDPMIPGVGYAATESRFFFGGSGTASFEGDFNTGDININITLNGANTGINWNFIGNPYPSAVDFDAFHAANATVVDGAAYFWSQFTPHAESNPGNEQSNFSKNDYATYTVGSGGVAGASGVIPTQYIPSAQGFFIPALTVGTATFTNAMRMADGTSNSLFFKGSNKSKSSNLANRLWLNLTSENGVFGQILLAYIEGATNGNDGLSYDAPKLVSEDYAAILYSKMDASPMKYVIQGKDINSLNEDEIIKLGFSSTIEDNTEYKLSIAQFEGGFLSSNPIYIKDNFLNELHDLSTSDYIFNSEDGTFNDRFEIVFSNKVLSTNEFDIEPNSLRILEIDDNHVQFTTSSPIKTIKIYDLLGRQLYELKGNSNQETYNLSSLVNTIFIAKVELLNGATITKKAIKK